MSSQEVDLTDSKDSTSLNTSMQSYHDSSHLDITLTNPSIKERSPIITPIQGLHKLQSSNSNSNDIIQDISTPNTELTPVANAKNSTSSTNSPTSNDININNKNSDIKLSKAEITSISGAMAGFISGIIVCPLDVGKTRLQAQGSYLKSHPNNSTFQSIRYKGLVNTLNVIYKEEGIRGLYRGLVPITFGYFPTWMIYFSCYEQCKPFYSDYIKDDNFSYFMSAITSGAVSTTLTNPIWVVKTRLMLQTGNGKSIYDRFNTTANSPPRDTTYYNSTIDAFIKMYKQEGLSSFYRGLVPSYFGLTHVAIQFPLYENFKKIFKVYELEEKFKNEHINADLLFRFIAASSLSKMIASGFTYPHEILRTRMQIHNIESDSIPQKSSKPTNIKSNFKIFSKLNNYKLIKIILSVYQNEGLKGFYSGFGINLLRTVPSSAVTLCSFEYFKNVLQRMNDISD
ncbi:unnamed protein product [[Candida] boidinii]|uniref:Unnamed protein product n=1 Tax=Candida boidinii TaxID=5477 RepID=A0A9W6SXD7_CANBO|nr:hypothetical protein BVG19_g3692 [[Candida] boidinii]OWB52496.1 hypothetical protein B5S27_g4072 [[Candida] boidinii]OWB69788.1 hypothetical protein B5S30_g5220 [[Candida] boidinii]OWB86799.1 hypothetical protein B5S33_g5513 [[Candida] boidinii]GME68981.1 unnamed protein product [[Candida] boidinii]